MVVEKFRVPSPFDPKGASAKLRVRRAWYAEQPQAELVEAEGRWPIVVDPGVLMYNDEAFSLYIGELLTYGKIDNLYGFPLACRLGERHPPLQRLIVL